MAVADNTRMSDEAVLAATGKHPDDWFELLDLAGATGWTHQQIASWLKTEHGTPPWWTQGITIRYEQARGLRLPGQKSDGTFAVSASKTVGGPLELAYAAMVSAFSAEFGGSPASSRADGARPYGRWSVGAEGSVLTTAEVVRDDRIRVAAVFEKLAGPDALDAAKARLQSALGRLNA
ncbi:MAG TPA: DUF4287 domain-containing protein [Pseudolysinimonas sp.]|jgi:hypothetical protein